MEKIVVSIVTWNSAGVIGACIESVLKQSYTNFDVYIFDNASSDKTLDVIKNINDQRIRIHSSTKNLGFCGGHNYIINISKGEFLLLLNPDVILFQDFFLNALATFKKSPHIGLVCGLLLQSSEINPRIDSAGLIFERDFRLKMRYNGEVLNTKDLHLEEVFGADGAALFLKRELIEDIKIDGELFDPVFFAHKEDWDVSLRSRMLGWRVYFNPDCRAIHPRVFHSNNITIRKNIPDFVKYHAVKNQFLLILKNADLSTLAINIFKIFTRQIVIFLFILLYERKSLQAYKFVIMNIGNILAQRKKVLSKRKITPSEFRMAINRFH